MKLLAWLCIAWRPPVSSTLTHISFINQRMRSPSRCTPKSTSLGAISSAAFANSGLSFGFSIVVCDRLVDELLSLRRQRREVLDQARDQLLGAASPARA